MEKQSVLARVVLEILGAPSEYVEKSLREYIDSIRKVHSIQKEVFHPAEPKESLFSSFCELEVIFKDSLELLDFCFESMPSSVEILEPASLVFSTNDLTDFLNDLQSRLHYADMMVKNMKAQSALLDKNATVIFQNFVVRLVEHSPSSIADLSRSIGISEQDLLPFAENLVKSGRIKKKNDLYLVENAEKQA